MTDALAVMAGGLGALARYEVGVRSRWATLAVNLSGAAALGVVVGLPVEGGALRVLGTGFLGAFTTFSGWMVESQRLRPAAAVLNLVGMLAAGVAATGAAVTLAS